MNSVFYVCVYYVFHDYVRNDKPIFKVSEIQQGKWVSSLELFFVGIFASNFTKKISNLAYNIICNE